METLNFMFYDLLNLLNDALNGGKDANLAFLAVYALAAIIFLTGVFLAGRISWKGAKAIEQAAIITVKKASAKLAK